MLHIHILKLHFQIINDVVHNKDGYSWNLTVVYDNPGEENKKFLWKDLVDIAPNNSNGWLVTSDFNDIWHMKEKRWGVAATRRKCSNFQGRLNNFSLVDLGS